MKKITSFGYKSGDILAGKYEVLALLGAGWEGEVYKVRERSTGIERTAKIFFPHRNVKQKASRFYAQKLHKLRQCHALIHYHTEETIFIDGTPVTVLVSEYVEGEMLSDFIRRFPGKRLPPFYALHLLYALAKGIEDIHLVDEYHGDLHIENIIVNRFGIKVHIKLLDMFHWGRSTKANREYDLTSMIQVFYECMGGRRYYASLPKEAKDICCGLRTSLILKKFRTVSQLREHLEVLSWTNAA